MAELILIGGGACAGKTTLARNLGRWLEGRSVICSLDSYYKDRRHLSSERTAESGCHHPDEMDWRRMLTDMRLMPGNQPVETPMHNFTTHRCGQFTLSIPTAQFAIIEGLFALYDPELVERAIAKIYVGCDEYLRIKRLIRRDAIERGGTEYETLRQYLSATESAQREITELAKANAELIVCGAGNPDAALMTVKDYLLGLPHFAAPMVKSGLQMRSRILNV
jgi:uridine kinase